MPHKKSHKKSARKSLKRRTMKKKGGYYGFSGKVGTGAPLWDKGDETGVPDYAKGGKRRKGRRTMKKRGGMRFSVASASFKGTGSRGIADYVDGGSTKGSPELGMFNVHKTS